MRHRLSRFGKDDRGSAAILFGLTALPLLMFGGVILDHSRAQQTKTRLQTAIDGLALDLGKLNPNVDLTAYAATAQSTVQKFMVGTGATNIVVTLSRPPGLGGIVNIDAKADTPTTITRIAGFRSMTSQTSSTVSRGVGNLEIAFVLDNTGSMNDNSKLSRLKSAAGNMIDSLVAQKDPSKPNALKFALVPFSMTVNIGSTYANSLFMDTGAQASYHGALFNQTSTNRFTMFSNLGMTWGGCVEQRPMPYDVDGTEPSSANPDSLYVPFFAPDESDNDTNAFANDYLYDYPTGGSSTSWKTRQGNQAKYRNAIWQSNTKGRRIVDRYGNGSNYLYGPNSGCEIAPIQRLSTDAAATKTAINAMVASGDTNITVGLAWGWNMLSPAYPFRDGIPYGTKDYTKIIVLMTDGQQQNLQVSTNNNSIYSGIGYIWQNRIGVGAGSSTAQRGTALDSRLSTLCSNIKAKGILIYTVRVEVTDGTSDILMNCASSPSMFYDVTDSSKLTDAFTAIGQSISQLAISK